MVVQRKRERVRGLKCDYIKLFEHFPPLFFPPLPDLLTFFFPTPIESKGRWWLEAVTW